jgi:adenylosuccinate synthase
LKAFIAKIEQFAGCEVEAIGTGPNREQYLDLK